MGMYHVIRYFLLAIFIFINVLLPGCTPIADDQYKTYEDKNNHFTIDYPGDWTVNTSFKDVTVGFESPAENVFDRYPEVLSVTAYPLPATAESPIEHYQRETIERLKEWSPELELVNSSTLTVHNIPAFQLVFKGIWDNVTITTLVTAVFKDKMGYQIAFACAGENYDEYMPIVEKAISSFKITE